MWANPVSYDKLGVRYRRWRNSGTAGTCPPRLPAFALAPGAAGAEQPQQHAARDRRACGTSPAVPPSPAAVASGDPAARTQAEAGLRPLSAGEIFSQEAAGAEAEPRA